jgi:hypothetical protein
MEKKKSDSISQNRCGYFYPQLMTRLCEKNSVKSKTVIKNVIAGAA